MTTFIGDNEKLHWKVATAKWQARLISLVTHVIDPRDPHGFLALVTPELIHITVPPMGARGSLIVTIPRRPPEEPDWEIYEQFRSVESCFYSGGEFEHPTLTPVSE